ncbi:hypothetical protein Y032_0288g1484 [Ancylostoma ceylanicum]|uniref:Uncharacterized protein n=1 Tax=Ancylostoma ceylanicum TaxID=53326 RepID=A0A016S6R6_9BILA|nr:hypothetical protein Y032_0288g1484 [Ancylostoma ceylanicum]
MKLLLAGLLLLIVDAHIVDSTALANKTLSARVNETVFALVNKTLAALANETDAGDSLSRAHLDRRSHKFFGRLLWGLGAAVVGAVTGFFGN